MAEMIYNSELLR